MVTQGKMLTWKLFFLGKSLRNSCKTFIITSFSITYLIIFHLLLIFSPFCNFFSAQFIILNNRIAFTLPFIYWNWIDTCFICIRMWNDNHRMETLFKLFFSVCFMVWKLVFFHLLNAIFHFIYDPIE